MMPKPGIFGKRCCVCMGITRWPLWPLTATSLRSCYNLAGEARFVHQGKCQHWHEQSALGLAEGEEARQAVERRIAYERRLCCVCGKDGGLLGRQPLQEITTLESHFNPDGLPSLVHSGDCNSTYLTSHCDFCHERDVRRHNEMVRQLRG